MTAPVLCHTDFKKRFFAEKCEHPIALFSQKLNPCQRNYSPTEKERYAAALATKRFRPYIISDKSSIIFFSTSNSYKK